MRAVLNLSLNLSNIAIIRLPVDCLATEVTVAGSQIIAHFARIWPPRCSSASRGADIIGIFG